MARLLYCLFITLPHPPQRGSFKKIPIIFISSIWLLGVWFKMPDSFPTQWDWQRVEPRHSGSWLCLSTRVCCPLNNHGPLTSQAGGCPAGFRENISHWSPVTKKKSCTYNILWPLLFSSLPASLTFVRQTSLQKAASLESSWPEFGALGFNQWLAGYFTWGMELQMFPSSVATSIQWG